MKNILKIFSITLVLGLATKAHAGLMLEPYLAYELSSELKANSILDYGGKTSGADLGLRAAYKLPVMVWLGLDYSLMSGGKYKGNSYDGKMDRSNLYFDVGVDLPILLRVWAGYGLINKETLKLDGSSADLVFKNGGSNIKLGVGLTMLPFVSLNLEYFMHDYKDYEAGSTSGSTDSAFNSHKESGLQLGVSLPFNI